MKHVFLSLLCLLALSTTAQVKPFRIGIDGLTHTHVHGLLSRAHDGDIAIVGIVEKNRDLATRYLKQHNISDTLLYSSLDEMILKARPEAVAAFNSIFEHLETVKVCAPRKIHVMVEKPLAVSLAHARQMEALAKKYAIQLLTNYETTWYGSNEKIIEALPAMGSVTKLVAHHGHYGPKEIGVNKEFLDWLTDPKLNGAGALMDFGCYGANLMTWLMKGIKPQTVFAITQQIKADIYPKVDDDATIILTYPKAQAIIQASWNWPYHRKDIEVYTTRGYVIADRNGMKIKPTLEASEQYIKAPRPSPPNHDPFVYFAAVVRKEIQPQPFNLSSLENNMIVMEILEAAKQSAIQGKKIALK